MFCQDWGCTIQAVAAGGIWLAALVALFGREFRKIWKHPNLKIEIPDRYPVETFFGTPPGTPNLPVFYLHLWVKNTGTEKADDVELLVEQIEVVQQDGTTKQHSLNNPTNLQVALGRGAISRTIHQDLGTHFDLGHISEPSQRDALRPQDSSPSVPQGEASFALEFSLLPNMRDYVLKKGTYHIGIVVVARNSKPQRRVVELKITGAWAANEDDMKQDGIGLRILSN